LGSTIACDANHSGGRTEPFSIFSTMGQVTVGGISWLLCAMIVFTIFYSSHACYLKNCPLGKREGKRSDDETENQSTRRCPRCGPDGVGRCAGPYTCCMENGGCLMGVSVDTAPCAIEQNSPIPCIFDDNAVRCGEDGDGVCASTALCCTAETCTLSSECERPTRMTMLKILQGE